MDGLLPVMLFILLPVVGVAVAALLALLALRDARVEAGVPALPPGKPDPAVGRALILAILPATNPIFGFVLYFLAVRAFSPLADDATIAIGTCIGLAGLFTALGQGILARVAARDIVRRPGAFGRHLVSVAQCETVVILAFAIAYLSMASSPPPASLARADYIMGASSVGALVSAVLAADVDALQMRRRMIRTLVGVALAAAGFLVAFLMLRMA